MQFSAINLDLRAVIQAMHLLGGLRHTTKWLMYYTEIEIVAREARPVIERF